MVTFFVEIRQKCVWNLLTELDRIDTWILSSCDVIHMPLLFVAAALASSLQFSCDNCGEAFESRIAAQTHRQYVCKRSDESSGGHTDSVQLLQDLGDRYQTASPFLNIKTERSVFFLFHLFIYYYWSVSWHFISLIDLLIFSIYYYY